MARPLRAVLDKIAERDVYPDTFSNGLPFVGAHKPSAEPLFRTWQVRSQKPS